eukprot:4294072-Pyramimonas_sp.AAC.1
MEHCPDASGIHSDFLGLVQLSDAPWTAVASRHHIYAGMRIKIRASPAWDAEFTIRKVAAH